MISNYCRLTLTTEPNVPDATLLSSKNSSCYKTHDEAIYHLASFTLGNFKIPRPYILWHSCQRPSLSWSWVVFLGKNPLPRKDSQKSLTERTPWPWNKAGHISKLGGSTDEDQKQASLFLPLSRRNHLLRNSPFWVNLWKTQPNSWKTQVWPNGPKICARRTKTDCKDRAFTA